MILYYVKNSAGFCVKSGTTSNKASALLQGKASETVHIGEKPSTLKWAAQSISAGMIDVIRKDEIKRKANAAILTLVTTEAQRNMLAKGLVELIDLLLEKTIITSSELSENSKLGIDMWKLSINPIRVASDQAELDGTLAEDFNP